MGRNALNQKGENVVMAFKRNDQKVMRKVYQNLFLKFSSYALKNSGNEAHAKDVFQEAFVACWRNIKEDKISDNSNVEGYLLTIAKNKWIDFLRSSNFKKMVVTNNFSNLSVLPDEEVIDQNAEESKKIILQKAIGKLGENCKNLLRLFYFERKSMAEISMELKIASTSARNQKYRCMERLRNLSLELRNNG